jgi:hypothetical protein
VPGIHDLRLSAASKTWIAGTSPAMTVERPQIAEAGYVGSII